MIIVLGMHRSGTSLTSSILVSLGVNMGCDGHRKDKNNEYGYWEDLDFVRLNHWILQKAKGDWSRPPKYQSVLDNAYIHKLRIERLLERKNKGLWGWKDPRTCLTIELYQPYLLEPVYIRCMRHRDAVYKSLQARGHTHDEKYWMSVIRTYNERANNAVENESVLYVNFERLIDKKKARNEVEKIAQFIDISLENVPKAMKRIQFSRKD